MCAGVDHLPCTYGSTGGSVYDIPSDGISVATWSGDHTGVLWGMDGRKFRAESSGPKVKARVVVCIISWTHGESGGRSSRRSDFESRTIVAVHHAAPHPEVRVVGESSRGWGQLLITYFLLESEGPRFPPPLYHSMRLFESELHFFNASEG